MSSNEAQYLLEFLQVDPDTKGTKYDIGPATSAMNAVCEQIDVLSSMGKMRFEGYKRSIPGLWNLVFNAFITPSSNQSSFDTHRRSKRNIANELVFLLRDVRDNWINMSITLDENGAASLNELLSEVSDAVMKDKSLPPDMHIFIMRTVSILKINLSTFEVTEQFDFKNAVKDLFSSLHMAEATTSDSRIWEKVKEKSSSFIRGFIVYVAPLALETAQLGLQIAQS